MAILYIVATPIGNLGDITLRALETLKGVDLIIAEDTRVTKKLLDRHQIQKPIFSYHQHSPEQKKSEILQKLVLGANIAFLTDAGTPGISDPGNELLDFIVTKNPDIKIVPIPGSSAVTSALSVSGFNVNHFVFLGFMPSKHKAKSIRLIAQSEMAVVFFESPYRIIKTLGLLAEVLEKDRKVFIAREMTKIYETFYRGTISDVKDMLSKEKIKGELVVVVSGLN